MQEHSRYAVGIDIGTTKVRAVVSHIDEATGAPTVVGVGSAQNTGMRKGFVAHLGGPAQAIDAALADAERMSGYQVNTATLSINGVHIMSTHADGMIAVGAADHEITEDDLFRIEEVATVGKIPANREILDVVPHTYRLDGQDNIKDPLGMTGTRLEIDAHVVSALSPQLQNVQKVAESVKVEPRRIVPAGIAAARAVLSESQMENGVALVDIGGATTNIAIYEEGDLQFVSVLPVGGNNITNDLAIGLKTDPEVAEKVKVSHATLVSGDAKEAVSIKIEKETHTFSQVDIYDIVEARLDELFEAIQKELKRAGYAGKLPSGIVLTGGSAHLKGIVPYAKEALGLAVRVGKSAGFGGVAEDINEPEYATAIGLMLLDENGGHASRKEAGKKSKKAPGNAVMAFLNRFK